MKTFKFIIASILIVLGSGCGGGGSDEPTPAPVTPPSAATLVAPANNEECVTGAFVNASQSRVTFDWQAAANATSYVIVLKDLNTGAEYETSTSNTSMSITINKGTPYQWWVISKATGTTQTATSVKWKFYNAGDAVQNYAPFPAELISPDMGETVQQNTITLQWQGSDVDNDITSYEVYFGTNTNPLTNSPQSTTNSQLNNVSVTSGNNYYWLVVTIDEAGNSSNSEIFEFSVQ